WDTAHLLRVCGLLNRLGLVEARSAVFNFYRGFHDVVQAHGEPDELVEFFGEEGLLVAASTIGSSLNKHRDIWVDDRLLELFSERYPATDPEALLSTYARRDRAIAAYLKRVRKSRTRRNERFEMPVRDLTYYRALIDTGKRVGPIGTRAKLGKEVLDGLFADFRDEADSARSVRLARLLQYHRISGGKEKLLVLAKREGVPELRAMCRALSHFKDDRIREMAMKGVKSDRHVPIWLELLTKNYKHGDANLIVGLLNKCRTSDRIHQFVYPIKKIYRSSLSAECQRPLELLYERTNCGICREGLVRLLRRSKCLSELICSELRYDSYEETRKLGLRLNK
ncbi:MAG: hypothetical protein KA175_15540, partial [Flavobacteriales bacterium]|nr:hypothetical protein [Flavobacteriales bacterium]